MKRQTYNCYDCYIPDAKICPECGEEAFTPGSPYIYGADRDGNRGIAVTPYGCAECGHEEG